MAFVKATKKRSKLRMAITGPSGSGKTYTALRIARALGPRTAVFDTEAGAASKYSDTFDFDHDDTATTFPPERFIQAIREASAAGYDTIILDSLSHAWAGPGGLLEIVDQTAQASRAKDSFAAWKTGTPLQQAMTEAIIRAPIHVLACLRSKTETVKERDEVTGKNVVRKLGMAAVQRDGFEYEFDVVMDLDGDHVGAISKSRCSAVAGKVIHLPGEELGATLLAWVSEGVEPPRAPETTDDGWQRLFAAMTRIDEAETDDDVKAALRLFAEGLGPEVVEAERRALKAYAGRAVAQLRDVAWTGNDDAAAMVELLRGQRTRMQLAAEKASTPVAEAPRKPADDDVTNSEGGT